MRCLGRNSDNHCCYLSGKVCQFLEENTEPDFRWTCGLRRELGSWNAVLEDPRYLEEVQPQLDAMPKIEPTNCREYPGGTWECRQCYPVKHG